VIRPDKLFIYLLAFKFEENREYIYKTAEELEVELSVYNEHNERELLRLVNVNKGIETLGVVIVPDRNIGDYLNTLKKKVLK